MDFNEFDQIAATAWTNGQNILERAAENITGQPYEPMPRQYYRIYDGLGWPIACRLCEAVERWTIENDTHPVFVCEHEPIIAAGGLGIRQLDSHPLRIIDRWEEL